MKRALVLTAGVTVLFSGCNSEKADIEAGYAAPATADGDPSPAGTATPDDPSGAVAFVGGIYQAYLSGNRPDPSRYYSAKLSAAVSRLDGGLGYDPFCLCRKGDAFGYAIQRDDPLPDGGRRVEVEINSGEKRQTRVIILTRESGGWRVANFGEGKDAVSKP
jgi:hypothetical protein